MRDVRTHEAIVAKERYLALFEAFQAEQGASEPAWLRERRTEAIAHFDRLGFPTTLHEDWKYLDVAPVANLVRTPLVEIKDGSATNGTAPYLAQPGSPILNGAARHIEAHFVAGAGCRLVFVNGHYQEGLSSQAALPEGSFAGSLRAAILDGSAVVPEYLTRFADAATDAFTALNTAFFEDGAFIHIPDHAVVKAPLQLVFVSTAGEAAMVAHPRNLIVLGASSQAQVIETYVSAAEDVYFDNAVTEVVLGPNAHLDHYKVQLESERAFHIATMQVQSSRDSNFFSHSFAFGGRIVRNNANAVMAGEGIECTLNGLYIARGEQLIDNHTIMDHARPNCTSYEAYAGILQDKSRGVFNGKIYVRPDAQKTDAKQSNRSLLLSRDAEIDTKPQLEIFADDVKCTHGATVGELDENALFYLRARGIDEQTARNLLVRAFAGDILGHVRIEALREQLEQQLNERLG